MLFSVVMWTGYVFLGYVVARVIGDMITNQKTLQEAFRRWNENG